MLEEKASFFWQSGRLFGNQSDDRAAVTYGVLFFSMDSSGWREIGTTKQNIPPDWAEPVQRCREAIKAVAQYDQVIPLSSRKQIQR